MNVDLTKDELQILLQLINQSNWKGEGVEIAVGLKKKLTIIKVPIDPITDKKI